MSTTSGPAPQKPKKDIAYTLKARGEFVEQVLAEISKHKGWTLGGFLGDLFANAQGNDPRKGRRKAAMITSFLRGGDALTADEVIELMYTHPFSSPDSDFRSSINRTAEDARNASEQRMKANNVIWAQDLLREWAIEKVEGILDEEGAAVSSKEGGFHLPAKQASWDFILNFSMAEALTLIESKGPLLLRLLIAAVYPKADRPKPELCDVDLSDDPGSGDVTSSEEKRHPSYAVYMSKATPKGTGQNRTDPFMIIMTVYLILMSARNLRFKLFQKIMAVWLFANNAAYEVFVVLARIGLSVSYTTLLELLRSISKSAQETVRTKARFRAFLLIYDNINRMIRAWDPDLGKKDTIQNGTAATFIVLEDCDVEKAFDVKTLRDARSRGQRRELDVDVLYERVEWQKLDAILAVHCLSILINAVPILGTHSKYIQEQLRGPLSMHRMREGRITEIHPLATSDFNEGNTSENAKVLDDLLLRQLGLPKEEVERLLVIVGGDQSTVEKLRTLKKFMDSCPHGYTRYGWVLPLIQLWHMGWADLERILSAHWGTAHSDDLSSLESANVLLGRKVKDTKRPDYYPALHLVFDTLTADILDCWKTHLGAPDLDMYFAENPSIIEDLQTMADTIGARYLSGSAYRCALNGGDRAKEFFVNGKPWNHARAAVEHDATHPGDQILANTILRMRDSMIHYEFQYAIADGDIGRAMNVMAVWTFTFTGCGKNKYSNELLELACNFEYEYSSELKKAILNNWLCNLTGYPGCWFPMDLLQEKNIKQLKKMAQRRDARFGGSFYKDIIALNIRGFLLSKQSARLMVGLGARGGSHRRTTKEAAMRKLSSRMEESGLHTFRAGRALGHVARYDYSVGYRILTDTNRIRDFIARTLRDAGDLHSVEDAAEESPSQEGNSGEDQFDEMLPPVAIDGVLVLGDELDIEEDEEDGASFTVLDEED